MFKSNVILNVYKNLESVKYWIAFLENWNKQNGKNYNSFSNKITNGNGCKNLFWLYGEKVRLQQELKSKSIKFKNFYKNNYQVKTNVIFK